MFWAAVMAGRVEVVAAARDLAEIEFGKEQTLLVVQRPRKNLPKRIDDHIAAAADDLVGVYDSRSRTAGERPSLCAT